jgi:hypothetical protein
MVRICAPGGVPRCLNSRPNTPRRSLHAAAVLSAKWQGPRSTRSASPAARFRLRVESLDGRDLPSFAAPVAYLVPQPLAVVAADVNGDGRPDLLTLAEDGSSVSVQLNLKKGGFGTAQTFVDGGQTAAAMAVGDVSGDGKPDTLGAHCTSTNLLRSGHLDRRTKESFSWRGWYLHSAIGLKAFSANFGGVQSGP